MRRPLLCLLLLLPGCSDGGADCSEAETAAEKQAEVVLEIRAQREKAEGQGSGVPAASRGVITDLENQDRAQTRIASQIIVGSPACFSVTEVATAREYLDKTD